MLFVPVKSVEQQSMLCVHRLREGFKAERTACINRLRGLLAEFGLVFAKSPAALQAVLSRCARRRQQRDEHPGPAGAAARASQWRELDAHMAWCDQRIAAHASDNPAVKKATTLQGIGPIGASAAVATVGDFKQFRHGAQFGAWIGLTPRQDSSGGKNSLGGITKRGDVYLRSLLIQGAKSAVMTAHKRRTRSRSGRPRCETAPAGKRRRWPWPIRMRASCGR